jgi:hypothetical protein
MAQTGRKGRRRALSRLAYLPIFAKGDVRAVGIVDQLQSSRSTVTGP